MCKDCKNKGICGYTKSDKFKGSMSENSIKTCRDRDELSNRLRYDEMAVAHHEKEGNLCQIKFFSEGVKLINKMLKLKRFQS